MVPFKRFLGVCGVLGLLAVGLSSGVSAEDFLLKPRGWDFQEFGGVPVQSGGRIKPLDSMAREVMLFTTGSRQFEGWDPVEFVLSWMVDPSTWEKKEMILVSHEAVKKQLGLSEDRKRFSVDELIHRTSLVQYAEKLGGSAGMAGQAQTADQKLAQNGPKQDSREQELRRVIERVSLFRNLTGGQSWTVLPRGGEARWGSLAEGTKEDARVIALFIDSFKAYKEGNASAFATLSKDLKTAVQAAVPEAKKAELSKVSAEVMYNHTRPYLTAWVLYLVAALFWTLSVWLGGGTGKAKGHWNKFGLILTYCALVVHVFGLSVRCYIAGRPPVTNMYESIVWVSLGVMMFAMIMYHVQKQRQAVLLAVASTLATLGLLAADSAPMIMDPSIQPLVPVLRSNLWLTIHVLTITLGYSAFALTYGIANVALFLHGKAALKKPAPGFAARIQNLNQLTYRAMQFGVVLLAAGTILGGVWADYSWGRFWGWDPKEVWALIALLCYLIVLHGRFAGWIGVYGFAAWSVVGFSSVVMAWYGVNFVLGVGKHAYGFASGGLGIVATAVLVQLLFVIGVTVLTKSKKSKVS